VADAAANVSLDAQTSSTPSPGDWTQFLRDNMERWNPYETTIGVDNVGALGLKWTFVPDRQDNSQFSSAAVVNGVVYVGSNDGNVYALNANTRAKLWSFANEGGVSSSPAVANGVVYIGGFADPFGVIYAINAATGEELWSYTIDYYVATPAVANGVVYVGCSDGGVVALNASTGTLLWSNTDPVLAPLSVANGVVYVSERTGVVNALNASTGDQLWNYYIGSSAPLARDDASAPVIANGIVYVSSAFTDTVYALNASTGAKLWSYTTGNSGFASPAVANGVVYIGSGDGNVYALNASTGAKLWSYATGNQVYSSPAVANGVVYVGSDDGNFYALNATTGVKLWSYATGGSVGDPVVANGRVYVGATYAGSGNVEDYAFLFAFGLGGGGTGADLYLRILPTPTTVHQGDLITYAFPVWNLGPANADYEVLKTEVPDGTTFDYIRISGTKGLGTCTTPPYEGTGEIVCHENSTMAPNTTWTVRLTVKVTAPAGVVIAESGAAISDTTDPNFANNTATVSTTVQ
jgi:outer membrane protein assembly factor BamB